jgi:hypothetical protein
VRGDTASDGRIAARAVRCAVLLDELKAQWQLLIDNIAKGDMATFNRPVFPKGEVTGVGFHEAPRGVLSHWIVIADGKIKNYQAVVPSTWNAGPHERLFQHGVVPIDRGAPDQAQLNIRSAPHSGGGAKIAGGPSCANTSLRSARRARFLGCHSWVRCPVRIYTIPITLPCASPRNPTRAQSDHCSVRLRRRVCCE